MPNIDINAVVDQVSKMNLASPTWDLFIILFFVVGTLVYGLSMGKERVIMLIVAIYMDLAVVNNAPYLSSFKAQISLGQAFALEITTFISVFLILFFLLSKTALSNAFSLGEHGRIWQVLLFSMLHIGLLTSVVLSYLPADALAHLTPVTREIFTSDNGKFVWIMLPIVSMILLGKSKKKE